MKVAAFGRTNWLYESVRAVAARGHTITLLGTARAADEYGVGHDEFETLARDLGCDYFYASSLGRADIREKLVDSEAEVAISVNWPTVIDETVLSTFPRGVLNAHAGDLPRYRGNAAPNWSILHGEAECVVCVHQMSPELDAGPVYSKRRMPLNDGTYVRDIYRFLDEQIPQMFADTIDGLESGRCQSQVQSDAPQLSLRCLPRKEQDGLIDWEHSADAIRRLVQCSSEPFHGAFTHLDIQKLIVWRARDEPLPGPHVGIPGQVVEIRRDCGEVSVFTGSGLLVLEEIETESEGRCSPSNVIKSTRTRLGMHLAMQVSKLTQRLADLEQQIASLWGTQATTEPVSKHVEQPHRDPAEVHQVQQLGYSLESYKLILSTFKHNGFRIVPLSAPVADRNAPALYLRHDVDYSLEVAERMAEANQELGVSGCFFVNPRCPLYNVASEDSLASVARIRALGQTIGLHVTLLGDEVESIIHDAERIAQYVQREYNLLSSIVGEVEPVMSWHNPSLAGERFQNRLCDEIRGIFNAYSLSDRGVAYMGDTNHRYSTAQWLDAARSGRGSVQATFHPYTWVLGAPTMEETLARTWPLLIRQCEKEFLSNHTYRAACPDGLPGDELSRWVEPLYRSVLTRDRAV